MAELFLAIYRERTVVIQGRASDTLVFELGGECYRSGDVRMA